MCINVNVENCFPLFLNYSYVGHLIFKYILCSTCLLCMIEMAVTCFTLQHVPFDSQLRQTVCGFFFFIK